MRALLCCLALCIFACASPDDEPKRLEPSAEVLADYIDTSERLVSSHVDGGRVVARYRDGTPADTGDGLIFGGIALAALPCEIGAELERTLASEIIARNGVLARHPSLADQVSLDGALGLWYGVADRIARCPGSRDLWRPAIGAHLAFVERNKGRLNPGSSAYVPAEFTYVLDLLAHRLDLRGMPHNDRLHILGAQVGIWARAVTSTRASCFRVHLGWLTLATVDKLGKEAPRGSFCRGSSGGDQPIVDNYCGRASLVDWLAKYKQNEWGYRHQRCGAWETPDGNGREQPWLDKLIAMRIAYKLD